MRTIGIGLVARAFTLFGHSVQDSPVSTHNRALSSGCDILEAWLTFVADVLSGNVVGTLRTDVTFTLVGNLAIGTGFTTLRSIVEDLIRLAGHTLVRLKAQIETRLAGMMDTLLGLLVVECASRAVYTFVGVIDIVSALGAGMAPAVDLHGSILGAECTVIGLYTVDGALGAGLTFQGGLVEVFW